MAFLSRRPGMVLAGAALLLAVSSDAHAQTTAYRLGQFGVSVLGISASVDPAEPVVPKNTAAGVRIVVRGGGEVLSAAEVAELLGSEFRVEAELSGPGLPQTVTLPDGILGLPAAADPLLVPFPSLPVAGRYTLTNVRLVGNGQSLLDVEPASIAVRVIDRVLISSVKTRALTLDEIRDKGIVLDADDYLAFEFTMAFKLDSDVVNVRFSTVFDSRGVAIPGSQFDTYSQVQRQLPLAMPPVLEPILLMPAVSGGSSAMDIKLTSGETVPVRIPSVLVIPGNVGYLKQFFSAQLYVANGAPAGSGLTVRDVTGAIELPAGENHQLELSEVTGECETPECDDPLALPEIERDGETVTQPRKLPVLGVGLDGVSGTSDDDGAFAPGEQGQAEFLLRGEKEGYHALGFQIAATLDGLATGPVVITGKATGGVLVRNARFDVNFIVPSTVRAGERFKVFATVQNIGQGNAHDVTMALDTTRIANLRLIGESTRSVLAIAPRGTWEVEYEFESRTTGRVTASYMRFDTPSGVSGDATGTLKFVVGVDERGAALSPDTLVLPASVERLPASVVTAAMRVLGQAWGVANATSALPSGVKPIARQTVYDRSLLLAEAGLRTTFGQAPSDAIRDLVLDFYGGDPIDAGFDQLLRETEAGRSLAQALGEALAPAVSAAGALDYEQDFAGIAASGPDFVSFSVVGAGATVIDAAGRTLSPTASEIPGGVVVPVGVAGAPVQLGLLARPTSERYVLRVPAGAAFSLSYTRSDGRYGRVEGSSTYAAQLILERSAEDALVLVEDADADGTYGSAGDSSQALTVAAAASSGPALVSARIVGRETFPSGGSDHGNTAALLFDRVVDPETSTTLSSYQIPANAVVWAKRQLSGRFVLATLAQPEGPYVATTVTASGITDGRGVEGPAATVPFVSLLTLPGAVVSGHVVQADGTPLRQATVYLSNSPLRNPACGIGGLTAVAALPVDGDGAFVARYVAQTECGRPFSLTAKDPESTISRTVEGNVRAAGEHITLDIALVGKGSVTGTVKNLSGEPVAGAAVLVRSLIDRGVARETTTDGEGRYVAYGLTVGVVETRAAKGVELGRNSGRIERAGETATVNVVLDGGTVRVSGRYTRVESGAVSAVPGKLVIYSIEGVGNGGAAGYAWTDGDGHYEMDGLPFGPFRLTVRGSSVTAAGQAFPNDDLAVDLVEEGSAPAASGHVKGTVFYPYNNADGTRARAAGVIVTPDSGRVLANYVYTDANGSFDLSGIQSGRSTGLHALTRNRARLGRAYVTIDPANVDAQGVPVLEGVEITLEPLGAAELTVLDPQGTPLVGQEVRVLGVGLTEEGTWGACANPCGCMAQVTGAGGRVRFQNVRSGAFKVKALRLVDGVMDVVNGSVTVTGEGQTSYGVLRFGGVGSVELTTISPPGTSVTGGEYVVRAPKFKNDGLTTCDLVTDDTRRGLLVLENGAKTTVSGVNLGQVTVEATNVFDGGRPVRASGVLKAHGEVLSLPIQWTNLNPGEISGHVYLPDGVTRAGAGVEVRADGPLPNVTVYTTADGTYAFAKILPPGAYTLTLRDAASGGLAQSRVQVGVGQSITHDLRLKGRGQVTVRVTRSDLTPLDTAFVTLSEVDFPKRAFDGVVRPGDGGAVVFSEVFEGALSVKVSDPYARGGRASGTLAGPGETAEIAVTVTDTGTIRGRFLMPDATTPIPYAIVSLRRGNTVIGRGTTSSSGEIGSFEFEYVPVLGSTEEDMVIELEDPLTRLTGSGRVRLATDGEEQYVEVVALGLGTVAGGVQQTHVGTVEAVPNAELRLASGAYAITAFADETGAYAVPGVPEGAVTVKAGLRSIRENLPLLFEGSATGALIGQGQTLPLDVLLLETTSIDVHVVHADSTPLGTGEVATVKLWLISGGRNVWELSVPTSAGVAHFARVPVGTLKASVDLLDSADRGVGEIAVTSAGGDVTLPLNGVGALTVYVAMSGGQPVSGAVVVADARGGSFYVQKHAQLTGSSYTFTDLPYGPVNLSVKATPGSFALTAAATVTLGSASQDVTINLPPTGDVHGTVKLESGAAAVGADVTISAAGRTATVQAQADGLTARFSFSGVPEGTYTLTVDEPVTRGKAVVSNLGVNAGATTEVPEITLDATPPAIAFLAPLDGASYTNMTGPLTIALSDAGTGLDLSTFRLTYPSGSSVGVSFFTQTGDSASKQLYATLSTRYFSSGVNRLRASVADRSGQVTETSITFSLTGGTVSGHVTRAGSGAPVVGASVRLCSEYALTTDASGAYWQTGVRPGSCAALVTDPASGASASSAGTLPDGGTLTLDVVLPVVRHVKGSVLRADGVRPAPSAQVNLPGGYVVSNSVGEFDLGYVKVGDSWVSARTGLGDHADPMNVTVEEGDGIQMLPPLVLNGMGSVTVTVLDGVDAAVGGAVVTVATSQGTADTGLTSATGQVTLSNVLAGTLTVSATSGALRGTASGTLTLTDEGHVDVTVKVEDHVAPTVASVAPASGAVNVDTATVVRVGFSEPLANNDAPDDNLRGLIRLVPTVPAGPDVVGAITLDATGRVATFTPQSLQQDATYQVRVSGAVDLSGNAQAGTFLAQFKTKDSQPPTLVMATPDDTWITATQPTVSIGVTDTGSGPDTTTGTLTLDGVAVGPIETHSTGYTYVPPAPLSQGWHTVEATARDLAGNVGSVSTQFGVDSLPPTITEIVVPAGPLSGTVQMRVTATDAGAGVYNIALVDGVSPGSITATYCEPVRSPCTVTLSLHTWLLSEGTHTIRARASDNAYPGRNTGGESDQAVSVVVDNAPLVTISAPRPGKAVGGGVEVRATVNESLEGIQFAVVGAPETAVTVPGVSGQTTYSATLSLAGVAEGSASVVVTACRSVADCEQASVAIVVDHTAPAAPNASLMSAMDVGDGWAFADGGPGAVEGSATVELLNATTSAVSTVTAWPNGSFESNVAAAPGQTIQVTAIDAALNRSAATPLVVEEPANGDGVPLAGLNLWLKDPDVNVSNPENGTWTWTDSSGKGNHATQATTAAKPTGVDAGFADGSGTFPKAAVRLNGTSQYMSFPRMTDIRTVFWVIREDPAAGNGSRFLLGDSSASDFTPGTGHQIWSTSTSALIRNGQTWINGEAISDVTTRVRPTTMSVVSLVTTGPVAAASLSRNGTGAGYWRGDVAELLVYSRELSSAERKAVEDYLAVKYGRYVPTPVAPILSPNGGSFTGSTTVSLSTLTPDVQIRYTLDGSTPTASSDLYEGPLTLNHTTTVKAITLHATRGASAVSTATFIESGDFAPLALGQPILWLRADAGLEVTPESTVRRWLDQSGTGNHAVSPLASASQPTVSYPTELNGLRALHFDGTNDWLQFAQRMTTIRTVFWLIREDPAATGGKRYLLSDNLTSGATSDFYGGTTHEIWSSAASASIRNGQTWINGAPVVGTATNRPTAMSVISLVTTDPVTASDFGKSGVNSIPWWGDLAELIVYDRELTPSERREVEDYLLARYRPQGAQTPVSVPMISPPGGTFAGFVSVSLSATTPGAEIYYTLDKSDPDPNRLEARENVHHYTGQFEVSATTTVKARAYLDGLAPSGVATVTFVQEQEALPTLIGQPADPLQPSNLRLWLSADAGIDTNMGDLVTLWLDQSGNENHARQTGPTFIPRLTTVPGGLNGLPAVHFDGIDDRVDFTERMTDIRTVFWVVREEPTAPDGGRFLLGDGTTSSDFFGGYAHQVWHVSASASIRNGQTWVDGAPVDGTQTPRPTTMSVVSVVTTGPVAASNFSRAKPSTAYTFWWGDLAELIVYNRALSVVERKLVEDYLLSKYRPQEEDTPASTPLISPAGGAFSGSVSVTLSSTTPGAEIYYTLDGSDPNRAENPQGALLYTDALALSATTTVRARAYRAGFAPSAVATMTFLRQEDAPPWLVGQTGSSLRLWLRADAGLATNAGDFVTQWLDQSGNGNNATQTTAAFIPRLVTVPDELNGLPAVHFDGTDDRVEFAQRMTDIRTVFWVVREEPAAPPARRVLLGDNATTYHFSGGFDHQMWHQSASSPAIRDGGQTWVNGAWVDGTARNRPTTMSVVSVLTTGPVAASNLTKSRTAGDSQDAFWWGDVAEVIVYNRRLTCAERDQVEQYLGLRYGITLPAPGTAVCVDE